jgi:hypothetical protein
VSGVIPISSSLSTCKAATIDSVQMKASHGFNKSGWIGVGFCRCFFTSKIYGDQDHVFLFQGGLANYEEL